MVSSTPGKTRLLNYFLVNEKIYFVDLPGYGYAKVPTAVKKKWGPMVETYVIRRTTLKAVVVLMDVRRMPGEEESNLIHWLHHYGITTIPVLTKADKLSKSKLNRQRQAVAQVLGWTPEDLILFSAKYCFGKSGPNLVNKSTSNLNCLAVIPQ